MFHLLFILILKQQQLAVLSFFDLEIFVVSYCQIYSFHPSLNVDKIVIFQSFQQTAEEVNQEHVPFFNKTTFYQLKNATSAVLA